MSALRSCFSFLAVIGTLFTGSAARAEVQLPTAFSDHMVLQCETRAPLWGTAEPGENVTVRFRDQTKSTKAASDGTWRVEFTELKAGGPDELVVSGDKNSRTIKDVLVGEVWVGSGQSNMAGALSSYLDTDPELKKLKFAGPYPKIRLLKGNGPWAEATVNNVGQFSALLFPFGQALQQERDVPIGLILGAVGGTPSGAWLSKSMLADDAAAQELMAKYAKTYPDQVRHYETKTLPAAQAAADKAKADGKPAVRIPPPPAEPGKLNGNREVGYLFEAHLRSVVGYGIRGVLWDQGESGTALSGVDQYTTMGALIRGWRKEWNCGEFPFVYVQKPSGGGCAWDNENPVTAQGQPFSKLPPKPPALNEGLSVETHVKIMTYPNVGMAISSDLGAGVHPANKSGYGRRAARVALGMVYDEPLEYYGPLYKSHQVEGSSIRVNFTHTGRGLAVRHADQLQGFAVAGEDKVFHWAEARIDGDAVVVRSDAVEKPAAVRYGWSSNRTWANLFNLDGLPAITFRTDAW